MDDRLAGFLYSSDNSFEPVELVPGHTTSPPVDAEDPDFDTLAHQWMDAANGRGTDDFHVMVAKNQHAAYQRGRFRVGSGIGGQLISARVDRDGLSVRVAHEFPGYEESRADLVRSAAG